MSTVTLSRLDWPTRWGPAPRFATPRSDLPSFGPAIGRIAAELGQPLFPNQQYVQDVANEVEADGSWRYDTVVLIWPRRAGKTHQIKTLVAHRCSRSPIMAAITAQTRDYAVRRWSELAVNQRDMGLWHSPLRPKLRDLHVGTSKEKLMWTNDSVFYPFAPNADANHGDPPDLVIVDELWAHSLATKQDVQQGYRPAWSVKPGQEWLLSAAGNLRSQWLKQVRAVGRRAVTDPSSRVAYFEWSVPEVAVRPELTDRELINLVLEYHPRRDHGLRHGYLAGELAEHGRPGFLRAYGNIDEDGLGDAMVISEDAWSERMRVGVQPPGGARVCVAVACDPGGRESTVAAAWEDDSGRLVTHTVKHGAGVLWAEGYASEVGAGPDVGLVVTANVGHGRTVAMVAENRGDPLHRMTGPDLAAAATAWMQGVTDPAGWVVHDGHAALEDALRRVDLPAGKSWVSRAGEPITAIEAHSMALWGLGRMPEPETPAPRFRIY